MDYYKKYQKYKFKYLNLLSLTNHQSGGGSDYTEEDFILLDKYLYSEYNKSILTEEDVDILKNFIDFDGDEENLLRDKSNKKFLEDPISGGFIHIKNAVLINKEVYDVNSLFNWINYTIKKNLDGDEENLDINIPHNRQSYSLTNLIDIRNKLDNDEDKNIIKKLIVEKFPVKVRTQLNQLKPEQLEILFTKIKINILNLDLEFNHTILDLINYLLKNNITDKNNNITYNFINDLKTNYKLLILVPENKMTFEICMIAVKNNSSALKYIPKNNIMKLPDYYDICWEAVNKNGLILEYVSEHMKEIYGIHYQAVTNNGLALKFIPDKKKTFDICEIAVTNNGLALKFTPDEKKTFNICEIAVTKNGLALKYVPDDKKTPEICEIAVTKNGLALEFVSIDNITLEKYYKLCEKAVKNDGMAIKFISNIIFTSEKYYKLCEEAVKNDFYALMYIKGDNITSDEYYNLCILLKNKNYFLDFVPKNKLTYEIYLLAVTNNGHELIHIELNDNITEEQYYKLCEKAVENYGQAILFVKTEVIIELNEEREKYCKPKDMSPEQYYKLCEKALTKDGNALAYVNKNIKNITSDQYYKLYEKALTTSGSALEFIPKTLIDDTTTPFKYKPKNMTDEQYYELCIKAVTNNGLSIIYIPYNIRQNMGNEKYLEICKLAIANNIDAEPYAIPYEYIVQYMQNH
jgi:hypothetical protein